MKELSRRRALVVLEGGGGMGCLKKALGTLVLICPFLIKENKIQLHK
jgi:hypothetical protein